MKRLLPAILTVLLTAAPAVACPMCKESVPSSDAQSAGGLPSGFNNSIYFMLAGLFCVIGFLTFTIVKNVRGGSASSGKSAFPVVTRHD
jgi:hypothetical protein